MTAASGVTMTVTSYTADGHVTEGQRSAVSNGATITESFLYAYIATGVNAGLLQGVTLRRQVNGGAWSVVRQVQYAYYDGTQTYGGSVGDLMTASVLDDNNNVLTTSFYSYYTPGQPNGYADGPYYVYNPTSYMRLTTALGTNLGSLTDEQVAAYADNPFQCDAQQRVTQEDRLLGGTVAVRRPDEAGMAPAHRRPSEAQEGGPHARRLRRRGR